MDEWINKLKTFWLCAIVSIEQYSELLGRPVDFEEAFDFFIEEFLKLN